MMKQEFLDLASMQDIRQDWYEKIEKVYTYHPAIETKQAIVNLYLKYGMTVMEDMLPRAEIIEKIEYEIHCVKANLSNLEQKLREAAKR